MAESLEIIFSYNLFKEEKLTKQTYKPNLLNSDEKSSFDFKGYKLPNTMDLTLWGVYIFTNFVFFFTSAIVYKPNSKAIYHITLFDNYQLVELKLGDKVIIKFKDIIIEPNNLGSFNRIIDSQEYIFENGNLLLKKFTYKTNFLRAISKTIFRSSKFITMDLETRLVNNTMVPYAIGIYDGIESFSFFNRF